jgi:hypothetical protein
MVSSTTGLAASDPILPGDVHPAGYIALFGLSPPEDDLQSAFSYLGCGATGVGQGSALRWWADWHDGVLHTWGRNLSYHPHVHYLVPAGGLSPDGDRWLPARHNFLVPVRALSKLFRAKFRCALRRTTLRDDVPIDTWSRDWIVHCQPVGNGITALRYLAPYIFRVAISNRRIVKVTNEKVTFRYRPSDTDRPRTCTLSVIEFIRRFLQHVLPKGFVKVRYYGLFSPSLRYKVAIVALWLDAGRSPMTIDALDSSDQAEGTATDVRCPTCRRSMRLVQVFPPRRGPP